MMVRQIGRAGRCLLDVLGVLACASVWTADAAVLVPEELEIVIQEVMAEFQVPGLAVAVVDRNGTLYSATFGTRDVVTQDLVTPHTLFGLGSITKTFTAVGLSVHADAGRLDWSAPVRRYLPDFALGNTEVGERLTVRDLTSHRAGLPRHDALWYLDAYSSDEILRRLRYLPTAAPMGTVFQYNNILYSVAGGVAGQLSGAGWERDTADHVLAPVGMRETMLSFSDFVASPEKATAYFRGPDGRSAVDPRHTGAIAPAAAASSTLSDMTRYARFLLRGGVTDEGTRIVGEAQFRDLFVPRIDVSPVSSSPERGPLSYATGFYVQTYRGEEMVYHPGVIDGFSAMISVLPGRNVAVVVMTNMSGMNPAPGLITRHILDVALDAPPTDWVGRERLREAAARASHRAHEAAFDRLAAAGPATADRRRLSEYAGGYTHPAYGTIRLSEEGDGLAGRLHAKRFKLIRGPFDVFRVAETVWPLRRGLTMAFDRDSFGTITTLRAPLADGPTYTLNAGDLVFDRALENVPASGSVRDLVERAIGRYDGPESLEVSVDRDGVLLLTLGSAAARRLLWAGGASFAGIDAPPDTTTRVILDRTADDTVNGLYLVKSGSPYYWTRSPR